jgi:hypothetical protein
MGETLVFSPFLVRVLLLIFVFESFVFVLARTVDGGWDVPRRVRERDKDGDGAVCAVAVAGGIGSSSRCRSRG